VVLGEWAAVICIGVMCANFFIVTSVKGIEGYHKFRMMTIMIDYFIITLCSMLVAMGATTKSSSTEQVTIFFGNILLMVTFTVMINLFYPRLLRLATFIEQQGRYKRPKAYRSCHSFISLLYISIAAISLMQ
tara:strand:+ start:92391 stop:92786 length:396 start_codon:yes stop_codon:yes gene_type:complete